ncbi:MAG: hypothetical protein R3B84_04405 [Zavarzinella sp.]
MTGRLAWKKAFCGALLLSSCGCELFNGSRGRKVAVLPPVPELAAPAPVSPDSPPLPPGFSMDMLPPGAKLGHVGGQPVTTSPIRPFIPDSQPTTPVGQIKEQPSVVIPLQSPPALPLLPVGDDKKADNTPKEPISILPKPKLTEGEPKSVGNPQPISTLPLPKPAEPAPLPMDTQPAPGGVTFQPAPAKPQQPFTTEIIGSPKLDPLPKPKAVELTETKPKPIPLKDDQVYGHATDYRWLAGVLDYHRGENCWMLRYADFSEDDLHGGKVRLENNAILDRFHTGDHVLVEGELISQGDISSRIQFPLFQVRSVKERTIAK